MKLPLLAFHRPLGLIFILPRNMSTRTTIKMYQACTRITYFIKVRYIFLRNSGNVTQAPPFNVTLYKLAPPFLTVTHLCLPINNHKRN